MSKLGVILLADVARIGRKHETKKVASGFARNFLFPRGLAVLATKEGLKQVQKQKKQAVEQTKLQNELLAQSLKTLDGASLVLRVKASEQGHLFAGIHEGEIAKHIEAEKKIVFDPKLIKLSEPIKQLGEYEVLIGEGENQARLALKVEAI